MSPRLFNLHMDGVVREVNARVVGRKLKIHGENGERLIHRRSCVHCSFSLEGSCE